MSAPGNLARGPRSSIQLASGEEGLAMARRFAVRATVAAGWDQHADDVALLTSELATNALLHGARPIALTVRTGGDRLRVEVQDAAPTMPEELDAGLEGNYGRGLEIVAALADQWGAEQVADGKVVWAELRAVRPRASAAS
jgi:anti-sigma regulatory factor (Ser/Thr protein kinase)